MPRPSHLPALPSTGTGAAQAARRPSALRVVAALLALSACSGQESSVLLDLGAALPLARKHTEAGRVDLGAPSERAALLEGFGAARQARDGTSWRPVGPGSAAVHVWLFRPGAWVVRLRYRAAAAACSARLALDARPLLELAPAAGWTEVRTLVPGTDLVPGEHVLGLESACAGFEIDWLEFAPLGAAPAPPPAPSNPDGGTVQPAGSEWVFFARVPPHARRPRLEYGVEARDAALVVQLEADGAGWPAEVRAEHRLEPGQRLEELALELPASGDCSVRLRVLPLGKTLDGAARWLVPRLVASGLAPPSAEPAAPPPGRRLPPPPRDIFVFVLDAARSDHFGTYGSARLTSPWIDALAREGVVFPLARAPAPYTQASTATLMTGFEPETHDVRGVHSRLSDRAWTLAELLASAGYTTSASIGCANADRPFGFAQGFEFFAGGRHDRTLERVDELLRTRDRTFFYLHLFPPHHPYLPPPPFAGAYSSAFPGELVGDNDQLVALRRSRAGVPESERQRLLAQYDENLLYADHLVGDILGVAARAGRLDEALVVVLADHGEAFLEHGTVLHGYTLYEEETRIPMILRPPRSWGLAPRIVDELAGTVDVLPTLVELAGATDPVERRHGRSLVPLLLGQSPAAPAPPSYARAQGVQLAAALAGPRYKLHLHDGGLELYDLLADPGERADLARAQPFLAGWLRQQTLERHYRNLADQRNAGLSEEAVLDEQTERELRALGYIE